MLRRARFGWLVLIMLIAAAPGASPGAQGKDGKEKAASPVDVQKLEARVKADPDDAQAWIALGNGLFDTSQWERAAYAYRKALGIDPKNVNVRVDLGTCYRNLGDPERALKEYRTGISIDPRHKNARRNAGIVLLYDLERREEALVEFEKYLELAPDNPDRDSILQVINELRSDRREQ